MVARCEDQMEATQKGISERLFLGAAISFYIIYIMRHFYFLDFLSSANFIALLIAALLVFSKVAP